MRVNELQPSQHDGITALIGFKSVVGCLHTMPEQGGGNNLLRVGPPYFYSNEVAGVRGEDG